MIDHTHNVNLDCIECASDTFVSRTNFSTIFAQFKLGSLGFDLTFVRKHVENVSEFVVINC